MTRPSAAVAGAWSGVRGTATSTFAFSRTDWIFVSGQHNQDHAQADTTNGKVLGQQS